MRFFITVCCIHFSLHTMSQNFVLPDGEYMDTASNTSACCKDYNWYYYSAGGKYMQNSASTLTALQLYLKKDSTIYSGSGYITFRFTIDCEGKMMPKVQVLQTDERYRTFHLNKLLVNELFDFLKTMTRWRIVMTAGATPVSYKAFITFKIKDGKVVNIIP